MGGVVKINSCDKGAAKNVENVFLISLETWRLVTICSDLFEGSVSRDYQSTDPKISEAREVVVLLARNHEGGQVGRVDGQEDDGKQCPDA